MKELIIVDSRCKFGNEDFEKEVRKVENINTYLEVDLFDYINYDSIGKHELVIKDKCCRYPKGLALYNYGGCGYKLGSLYSNDLVIGLISNLESSYNNIGKETMNTLINIQVKAISSICTLEMLDLDQEVEFDKNTTYLGLSKKSKDLFYEFIKLETEDILCLDDYDVEEVECVLNKYRTDKYYESKTTESVFKEFCESYLFSGNCIYGEVTGSHILKNGLRAFAISTNGNFVYIDDRFSKGLIIDLPKQLLLSNLEGLLTTLEYYICYCVGGVNRGILGF